MVDLRSWRLPVAVVGTAAIAVRVAASILALIDDAMGGLGFLLAIANAAVGPGEIVLAITVAALCWWCAADAVPGARRLAGVAGALVIAQIVLSGAAAVAGFVLNGGSGLGSRVAFLLVQLTWLVVPVLTAIVLVRIAAPERSEPGVALPPGSAPVSVPAEIAVPEPVEQPFREAAGWAPDEAAGAVWSRAGEAATGAPASDWGSAAAPIGASSGGWGTTPAPTGASSGGWGSAPMTERAGDQQSGEGGAGTDEVRRPS